MIARAQRVSVSFGEALQAKRGDVWLGEDLNGFYAMSCELLAARKQCLRAEMDMCREHADRSSNALCWLSLASGWEKQQQASNQEPMSRCLARGLITIQLSCRQTKIARGLSRQ